MGKPGDMPGREVKKEPEVSAASNRKLRTEAEKKVALSKGKASPLKKLNLDKLVHELEVHQVELEMQNEELHRSHAELEAAKERYFDLYDLAPVGCFTISDKGVILEANLTAANMLGVLTRDLRAQQFSSLIFKADQDIYYLHRQQLFETREAHACEIRLVRKDGTLFWSQMLATLAQDATIGKPVLLATVIDINVRKHAEEALRESEERFRVAQEMSPDGFTILHPLRNEEGEIIDFTWVYENKTIARINGTDPEGVKGKRLLDLFPTHKGTSVFEAYIYVSNSGKPQIIEEVYVGEIVSRPTWLRLVVVSMGQDIAILALDITERKQAKESLRNSEAQYRLLAEHTTDTIRLLDMNLKTTYLSPSAEKQRGFMYHEILDLPLDRQLTPDSLSLAVGILSEELPRVKADPGYNPIHTLDLEYYCKDGTTVWAESKFSVIRDEIGNPISILAEARDITERKLSEEKLAKSYESLKKTLNDAINTMVKIVELRDPYTAGHQQKVAELSIAIASEMKLEDARLDQLRTAAMIHDIGKMYIPSDILSKPGKLSTIELGLIKTHSQSGYDIVKGMDFPGAVALAVLQHHERLDGSGYPSQLTGEDTLLEAKILAVADVVEAMSSHRPYRPALGIDKALEEVSKNKGKLYDPDAVDACVELFNSGRFEFK